VKSILYNPQTNQLRNGWWIIIFIAFLAVSRVLYPPISQGLQAMGVNKEYLGPLAVLFILAVSWCVTKLRNESLKDIGLNINLEWCKYSVLGFVVGGLQIALIVAAMTLGKGVYFAFNTEAAISSLFIGFYVFFFAVLLEELLFRGFLFQRLMAGIGEWPTLILMSALFAAGHLTNPEVNQDTIVFATLDIMLGAIVFGLAYIKTKSLALPIGLHLGWNWVQGNVFGFNVSGHDHVGLLVPTITDHPAWLTGAGFGPEATVFAVAVDLVLLITLVKWKGLNNQEK